MREIARVIVVMSLFMVMTSVISCSKQEATETDKKEGESAVTEKLTPQEAVEALKTEPGIFAVIDTSMGRIICELYPDVAPVGVENFVGLAEGTKEFTVPKTGEKTKRSYYDGLKFHRVIPDFMIQGGDPLGDGTGNPGYKFKNELSKDVQFDRAGRLAYANAGPGTNGSQFFITHKATPFLNPTSRGSYTIFGQTIAGQDVVVAIGNVPAVYDKNKREKSVPKDPVYIEKVTIVRIEKKEEK